MRFCTAINCIDGRAQLPVINYLQIRFDVEFVDTITEPGPNLILGEQTNGVLVQSILDRLKISVEKHHSVGIAIVGHQDCAGNPASEEKQLQHIKNAMSFLGQHYDNVEIIGLWVDDAWNVNELM